MDPTSDGLTPAQQQALGKLIVLEEDAAAEVVARWLHLTEHDDTSITERRDELDEEAEEGEDGEDDDVANGLR